MINYSIIRNGEYRRNEIRGINAHNERLKEAYRNPDIDSSRSELNIHFKRPNGLYTEVLDRLVTAKKVSIRGLKADAVLFNEFLLDINSRYFEDRGGYEFAQQFYADAYRFCCDEVGEENILSAVMHADERNKALSEELGRDVFHYHLHVVYLPVVEKEILYSKRCKDPALVGTVKEVVNQISHSKRWKSEPVLGEDGEPLRDDRGKVILAPSYGALQTRFAEYMQAHGYTDVERGVEGKRAKHKSIVDFKLSQDEARSKAAAAKVEQLELQGTQLEKEISAQIEELTSLQNMSEYTAEVEECHSLLKRLFDVIAEFFARTNLLRDRKKENDFFDFLRQGLIDFFGRLRNLLGFELVTQMPLGQCQSPVLAAEGEKLALNLQIAEASQRAGTGTNVQGKEHYR